MPQAAAPPRPRVVCKWSELSGGGTASMPVREKGRRAPGSQPARPFSRPQPPADRRQSAGLLLTASEFTAETDSHRWRGMDSKIQFRDLGRERDRKVIDCAPATERCTA